MTLSAQQRLALEVGSLTRWLGTREVGVMGSTMVGLERRGLAEVSTAGDLGLGYTGPGSPRRMLYRLTPAGVALDLELNAATRRRTATADTDGR